ncbi:hypothetical protein JCM10213_003324 [Rhodosporidiobolus nylandii]
MQIGPHVEDIEFNVSRVAHYPVILGIPWTRTHDVSLSFAANRADFHSDYCARHCLPSPAEPPSVPATSVASVATAPPAPPRPRPRCPDIAETTPIAPAAPRAAPPSPPRLISAAAAKLALRQGAEGFLLSASGIVPTLRAAAAALRRTDPQAPLDADELW